MKARAGGRAAAKGIFRDRERNQAGPVRMAFGGGRAGAQSRGQEIKKQRNQSRPPPPRSTAPIALLFIELLFFSVSRPAALEKLQGSVGFSTDFSIKNMLQLPPFGCGKAVHKANT